MLKNLHWVAALSIVTAAIAAPSIAIEPDQGCFMQTSSGRVVSLGQFCSGQTTRKVNAPTRSPRRSSSTTLNKAPNASSNTYLMKEGKGGYFDNATKTDHDYYYQIWSDQGNTYFELRVWRYQEYAQGRPFFRNRWFKTAVEAENEFACEYAQQPTAVCPRRTPKFPQ